MSKDPKLILPKGGKGIIKKPQGRIYYELSWHPDEHLDNIIEMQKFKDKKPVDDSSWIVKEDLEGWIDYYNNKGYTFEILENE